MFNVRSWLDWANATISSQEIYDIVYSLDSEPSVLVARLRRLAQSESGQNQFVYRTAIDAQVEKMTAIYKTFQEQLAPLYQKISAYDAAWKAKEFSSLKEILLFLDQRPQTELFQSRTLDRTVLTRQDARLLGLLAVYIKEGGETKITLENVQQEAGYPQTLEQIEYMQRIDQTSQRFLGVKKIAKELPQLEGIWTQATETHLELEATDPQSKTPQERKTLLERCCDLSTHYMQVRDAAVEIEELKKRSGASSFSDVTLPSLQEIDAALEGYSSLRKRFTDAIDIEVYGPSISGDQMNEMARTSSLLSQEPPKACCALM
jgi:hypothetical protein